MLRSYSHRCSCRDAMSTWKGILTLFTMVVVIVVQMGSGDSHVYENEHLQKSQTLDNQSEARGLSRDKDRVNVEFDTIIRRSLLDYLILNEDVADTDKGNKSVSSPDIVERVPFTDFVGCGVIGLVCTIAVTVGVGGGGLFVPILILLMGFSPHEATSLSQSLMAGGTLAGLFLNIFNRHPTADKPLIDEQLVLLSGPAQIGGSLVGVIVNGILPSWLIIALMLIVLGYTAVLTYRKAIQTYRMDRARQSMNDMTGMLLDSRCSGDFPLTLSSFSPYNDDVCAIGDGTVPSEEADTNFTDSPRGSSESETSPFHDILLAKVIFSEEAQAETQGESPTSKPRDISAGRRSTDDVRTRGDADSCQSSCVPAYIENRSSANRDSERENQEFPGIKTAISAGQAKQQVMCWTMVISIWAINMAVVIGRGGKRTQGVVKYCSAGYWMMGIGSLLFLTMTSALIGAFLVYFEKKRGRAREVTHVLSLEGDLHYTAQGACALVVQTFFAGIVAGIVGIGGGMILGPILLQKGVHPLVATAVNATLVLITSSSAAASFIISGQAPVDAALILAAVCFVSALIGKSVLDRQVKRHNLSSLLIFLLVGVIIASMVSMLVSGSLDISRHGLTGFQGPC